VIDPETKQAAASGASPHANPARASARYKFLGALRGKRHWPTPKEVAGNLWRNGADL